MAEKEYIERNAVIGEIESLSVTVTGLRDGKNLLTRYAKCYKDSVVKVLSDAPAADVVEVIHAHWIDRDEKTWCSKCDASNKQYKPPYCPHCGARMDGGKHDG